MSTQLVGRILTIIATAAVACVGAPLHAQNLVTNGDFSAGATGWTTHDLGAAGGPSTLDFTFTGDLPTGSSGQAARITSAVDQGGAFYQEVTLEAGKTYFLFFRSKDIGSGAQGVWCEAYLNTLPPIPGADYTRNKMSVFNTWNCDNWDGTNQSACEWRRFAYTATSTGIHYLLLKSGACCGQTGDVVIDDVSLIEVATGPNLLTNGDFASGTGAGWSQWQANATVGETLNFEFNETTLVPFGGTTPGYRVTQAGGYRNGGIYQPINLQAGQTYVVDGFSRDNGVIDGWGEIIFSTTPPVDGSDMGGAFFAYNTFAGCLLWDGDIQLDCSGVYTALSYTPDVTGTYYFVLKTGTLNNLDMSFDELSVRQAILPEPPATDSFRIY